MLVFSFKLKAALAHDRGVFNASFVKYMKNKKHLFSQKSASTNC